MVKKRIGSKEYNTETAIELFRNEGGNERDGTWFCDTVYKKRSGELFVWRQCGRRIAKDDLKVSNEQVVWEEVLVGKEAKAILTQEQWNEYMEIEKDPDKKEVRTFYLTNSAYDKLNRLAAEKGISKAELLELLITNASID